MYQPGCWVHIPTPPLFIQVTAMFWRARFSIIQLLQYSILLISHGYFSLKYSQQTLHNSPVRASYGVSLWVQSQPTLWFWCWHVVSNIMLYITMIYQEFTVQYLTNIFSNIHYTFDSYYIHSQPYRLLLILTITCLIYIYIYYYQCISTITPTLTQLLQAKPLYLPPFAKEIKQFHTKHLRRFVHAQLFYRLCFHGNTNQPTKM